MSERSSLHAEANLWIACVEQLAQELPEQQFNTWIRPLVAVVSSDLSCVTIQVGNRGTIPAELMESLFEPFQQGRTSHKGLGLGLYIAKGIVGHHHGEIWAESSLGAGSAFIFELPVAQPLGMHSPDKSPSQPSLTIVPPAPDSHGLAQHPHS